MGGLGGGRAAGLRGVHGWAVAGRIGAARFGVVGRMSARLHGGLLPARGGVPVRRVVIASRIVGAVSSGISSGAVGGMLASESCGARAAGGHAANCDGVCADRLGRSEFIFWRRCRGEGGAFAGAEVGGGGIRERRGIRTGSGVESLLHHLGLTAGLEIGSDEVGGRERDFVGRPVISGIGLGEFGLEICQYNLSSGGPKVSIPV